MLIPIDFNCLSSAIDGELELGNYYLEYAFEDKLDQVVDGLKITFYDEGWTENPNEIICFDAVINNSPLKKGKFIAKLTGEIYTKTGVPERKNFCSFIGAMSHELEDKKLNGVKCFCFSPNSNIPNFSNIIGMNYKQLEVFFKFEGTTPPQMIGEGYSDDTIVIRGGSNCSRGI